ncbi:MAG: hypothetical protein A2X96_12140 [Syntrophobacterales bacterium GWC2_56_13]|nr:MAG: hypothetical protein A2X96_12140 [Syntrophobacterales bacterium GWC2_56_13]
MLKSKRQRDEAELEDNLELSPEQIRELKRRVKDLEDPVRYVIHSDLLPAGRWRLFLNVSDDTWCDDINTATLFKGPRYALAVIHEYCEGKRDNLFLAKITTKNNRLKVLKYRWSEHPTG